MNKELVDQTRMQVPSLEFAEKLLERGEVVALQGLGVCPSFASMATKPLLHHSRESVYSSTCLTVGFLTRLWGDTNDLVDNQRPWCIQGDSINGSPPPYGQHQTGLCAVKQNPLVQCLLRRLSLSPTPMS